MKYYPCAKINLGLNIVDIRPDGYHDIETVFYPIPLRDSLEVMPTADGTFGRIALSVTDCPELAGNDNLVCRAYDAVGRYIDARASKSRPDGVKPATSAQLPSVDARLSKVIPTQAGLGGGSSDCASMINLLNSMFDLGLSINERCGIAAGLGADCPFFIDPKPMFAEGIGDILTDIDLDLTGWHIAIIKPPVAVSTRDAYALTVPRRPAINCREIVAMPVDNWRVLLVNDFEDSVFEQYPTLRNIKSSLYTCGAVYASMSGSGSAIFGLFRDTPKMDNEAFNGCFTWVSKL